MRHGSVSRKSWQSDSGLIARALLNRIHNSQYEGLAHKTEECWCSPGNAIRYEMSECWHACLVKCIDTTKFATALRCLDSSISVDDWLADSIVGAHNAADRILPHSDNSSKGQRLPAKCEDDSGGMMALQKEPLPATELQSSLQVAWRVLCP